MRIWIVNDTEPLPSDDGNRRLMPVGMLCSELSSRKFDVCWIASSFEHYLKKQRPTPSIGIRLSKNYTLNILPAPGYKRNVSPKRILHNRKFARAFSEFASRQEAQPDIIITTIPTTEAAQAVARYARKIGIPSVVIVHDLWPDFFADFTPRLLRPAARLATFSLNLQVKYACRNATSLIGVSSRYLDWAQAKAGPGRLTGHDRVFHLGYQPESALSEPEALGMLTSAGIPADKHIVLFVGSWGATYDLNLLALTAAKMTARQDIVFVVTGDGSARPDLHGTLSEMPNVVLTGWVDSTQIANLARHAAVGLLPYDRQAPQGLPNKVFEYMAYGAYQVSTLTGEIEELYLESAAGECVPDANPDTLAHALAAAIDSGRATSGRAERQAIFERQFKADQIYSAMAEHIESLISAAGVEERPA